MIIENIALLNLHDSDLLSTTVRTTDEGDENVSLRLDYISDYRTFETQPKILVFEKCWGVSLNFNFRVEGPDSIDSAEETAESEFIERILETHARMNLSPSTGLRHFVITTSSTGSRLDLVAESVRLIDVD
jgi:hypothetical protein